MTIHDLDKFIAAIQDWAILDGCFGTSKIKPSDIDGFVERNGVCLFLEAKGPEAFLTAGQAIAFTALARQGNTVVIFWGKDRDVHKMRVITADDPGTVKAATLQDLRNVVADWYNKASSNGSGRER